MKLETINCGQKSKGICSHRMNGECRNCLADLDPLHHSVDECNDYQEGIKPIVTSYTR